VDVLVATLDLFVQRLNLAGQTVGKIALELAQLIDICSQPAFPKRLVLLAQRASISLSPSARSLFLAQLACERFHLLLRI